MFSWVFSLLLLLNFQNKTTNLPSMGSGGSGNRHVAPADNPQPDGSQPPDSDGGGSQGGGGPKG